MTKKRLWASAIAMSAFMALGAGSASAAFIGFTEFEDGRPVDVSHDNNDWLNFSASSTAERAHAEATLFKSSTQGGTPGTYGFYLTEGGVDSDLLVVQVQNDDATQYSVIYDFYSDPDIPTIAAGFNFTATFRQEELAGGNSFGLPSYSQELFINSGTNEAPEPATLALVGLGLLGAGAARRKK